jgi:CheY-like chemotaxis protein
MTNLLTLFPAYASEAEAIKAFAGAVPSPKKETDASKTRIVCVDTSKDVLAELSALLTRSGYEVLTTRYIGEAVTLVKTTRPRVVICGPGMMAMPVAQEVIGNFQKLDEKPEVLTLPPDFYTADAGQAGENLLARLQTLTAV